MSRKVDYFIKADIAPEIEECEIINFDMRYVPHALRALEAQKTRSFWVDRESWIRGFQRLTLAQERLLMPCSEDIIREIRELRGSYSTDDTTLATWPVGDFPGLSLEDLSNLQYGDDGSTVGQNSKEARVLLGEIKTILETQGAGEEGQLEALLQIVALLGV